MDSISGSDTGYVQNLKITIIDPCITADLAIDDSVFKGIPAISLTYFVSENAESLAWTDDIVTSSIANLNLCGPYAFEIFDEANQ